MSREFARRPQPLPAPMVPPAPVAPGPRTSARASALATVRAFDRARRQRLVRVMTLGVAVITGVLIPSTLVPQPDYISLVAIAIVFVGALAAYVVNRLNRVTAAGSLLIAGGSLGIAWVITQRGINGGLAPVDLRMYDFFVLPIVAAGILLGRRGTIAVGVATAAYTTVSLLLLPHDPALQLYWDGRDPHTLGSVYDVIAIPVVIQALSAVAGWLGSDSVRRSLLSATRADELAAANEQIGAQARELELHQRRLQEGIAHLQAVHTAFASGNYDVRAQLNASELQPLATSVNRFLAQLQRLLREQDQRARIEQVARELTQSLRMVRAGYAYQPPAYTGTAFDQVLLELITLFQRHRAPAPPTAPPSPAGADTDNPFGWSGAQ